VLSYLSVSLGYLRARLGGQLREAGVTAVEYALMVAIIALLMVAGFYTLFNAVQTKYEDVGNCIATEPAPEDCSPPPAPPATLAP
jgi:Flp pilus assembly pilin Flp